MSPSMHRADCLASATPRRAHLADAAASIWPAKQQLRGNCSGSTADQCRELMCFRQCPTNKIHTHRQERVPEVCFSATQEEDWTQTQGLYYPKLLPSFDSNVSVSRLRQQQGKFAVAPKLSSKLERQTVICLARLTQSLLGSLADLDSTIHLQLERRVGFVWTDK